jgi:hypothetical protein
MTKPEIISLLTENHNRFVQILINLDKPQFTISINNKWPPAQELDHIIRSVSPVVMAFGLPSFILKWKFGKANRPSKTYDALVDKYHTKLAAGGRASGQFIPKGVPFSERESAVKKLKSLVDKLNNRVNLQTEEELDTLILPHPLLGKLTFREMLYFTAYHAVHHRENTLINLDTPPAQ